MFTPVPNPSFLNPADPSNPPSIHREGVLRQVVGPDREEVRLFGEDIREQRRGCRFDHDPDRYRWHAEIATDGLDHVAGGGPFGERRDHRKHHGHSARARGTQDRAQLRFEHVTAVQQQPDPALAEKRVGLGPDWQVRQRLVPADVQRADDENALWTQRPSDRFVGARLLLFVGRRAPLHEQEFGA